jgi:hypothetical protein
MSMIYIVVVNDRHGSPDAYPYTDKEHAISEARRAVEENARHPEMIEWDEPLNEAMIEDGWVFYVSYGVEGDSVWVVERELDKAY